MKDEIPAVILISTTILCAAFYATLKGIDKIQVPNFKICPLCEQEVKQ